jgi:hypothetical protein
MTELSPSAQALLALDAAVADGRLSPDVVSHVRLALEAGPRKSVEAAVAGFDGGKGIGLNNPQMTDGGVFRLRRGSECPWESGQAMPNQLYWRKADEPQLLYCNEAGAWFRLEFIPCSECPNLKSLPLSVCSNQARPSRGGV